MRVFCLMFLGPVFQREIVIAPRRTKMYASRTVYTIALLVLSATAWLIVSGSQLISDVGDMARFGNSLFSLIAPLQLVLAMFFSAIFSAGNVSQEKDRNTLVLLLLTQMNNLELVLGKLSASLLHLFVNLLAAVPVFFMIHCFGGVSTEQILQCLAITSTTVLFCGVLGTMIAFWREQTFQAVSMTTLVLVVWLALGECLAAGVFGETFSCPAWINGMLGNGNLSGDMGVISARELASALSPWQAILGITHFSAVTLPFPVVAVSASGILALWTVLRVRAWSRAERRQRDDVPTVKKEDTQNRSENKLEAGYEVEISGYEPVSGYRTESEGGKELGSEAVSEKKLEENSGKKSAQSVIQEREKAGREKVVWDNPILWREICTHAYGRRAFLVRLFYVVIFAVSAWAVHGHLNMLDLTFYEENAGVLLFTMKIFVPLALLALILVNAQAVTAITAERDGKAIDLLLVTDLSPKEIVFGKLGGVFWNTREMVVLPLAFLVYLWCRNVADGEITLYLCAGFSVLLLFSAVLGIHSGMTYAGSRSAIGVSLGTLFFLFVGVAVCLRMMLSMGGSFHAQLQPFLAFMAGGGLAMFLALGARNPSSAIGIASFGLPFATFYAMSALMMNYTLGVFLVVAVMYGFTTAAMLIPAISEFDIVVHHGNDT
ncbi:MAG: hypothetical protein Q4C70_10945 [Planctomycetia bacterium]|nr:hypothetical protein [Planctomycetia bacterium]